MRYIIVDDEPIAHDIIKRYGDMIPSLDFQKDCYDAIEALEFLKEESVDLIFLDLNMPKLKGFEFLRTLKNPPHIIVTTAYREYALEGYELDIVDYLLKPFSFERFLKAVNKLATKDDSEKVPARGHESPRRLFLHANKKHYQIDLDELLYIEASGNYTKLVLANETISIREKLSAAAEMLPQGDFIQVHRSFVVGKKHIKRIEGNQIFLGEANIPIGKSYKTKLSAALDL